jgi:glycine betaine/proline transport system permease protein
MVTDTQNPPIEENRFFSPQVRFVLTTVAIILVAVWLSRQFNELIRWPQEWVIPVKDWVTAYFYWLSHDLDFGLFKFRDITRGFSWLLSWPLYWSEVFLYRGWSGLGTLLPIPWPAALIGVGLIGHCIAGWRLSLFCMACTLYLVVFGLWEDAMRTFSLVAVAVPFSASIGLMLGVASTRNAKAESVLKVIFDFMQATPHMAYLGPIVIFFGFGQVPAMMAMVIFSMPIMARCTILGLRTVPASVIEAATMSGCTQRQLLWKVQIPAAQNTLMVGLNQVIMQTLAMAVIASLVGASGLGQKLLFSLQQLRIGTATEQGIAIVFLAIVLDRISQAAANRPPGRRVPHLFWQRHIHVILFAIAFVVFVALAQVSPALSVFPKSLTLTFGPGIDEGVKWFSLHFYPYVKPVRDWVTVAILLNVRLFYLVLPWIVTLSVLGYLSWRLGGWRLFVMNLALSSFVLLSGFWKPAMMTLYIVNIAVIISACIGISVGIWSAHNPRVAKIALTICDTLQTFPSFIYLIPVVMIFKVGDLSNIVAILAFATVPSIRYTYLGLSNIAPNTLDAATVSGCTRWQKLRKVELPIAMPEIMLGVNQTVLMSLFMTTITALIGSRDLGQEILKALPGADTGRGLLAGLSIAFIGIITDRLIHAWAKKRKASMGMSDD